MAEYIKRNYALREYDIKETPGGKQVTFSIRFIKKNGESVFLPRAVAAGLPYNLKENRLRGVIAIDANGNRIGHVYPVNIDLITEWNEKTVRL
jgi:hypothetical protein